MDSWNIKTFDYRLMRMELINKIIGDIVMKLNQNAQSQIEIFRKLGKSSMTMVTIYLILSTYLFIFQTNVFGSSSICNLEYRTLICFFNPKKTTMYHLSTPLTARLVSSRVTFVYILMQAIDKALLSGKHFGTF